MKALSLWQPWASLVAHRCKQIETRCWTTKYRGPIAIAATASKPKFLGKSALSPDFKRWYAMCGMPDEDKLPLGAIVCFASLVDVLETRELREELSDAELAFGNYEDGRYAWILEGIVKVEPIPAKGMQGLWTWNGVISSTSPDEKGNL